MMIRWGVDIAGIDLEADLQQEDNKPACPLLGPEVKGGWRRSSLRPAFARPEGRTGGELTTLTFDELREMQEERIATAVPITGPFCTSSGGGAPAPPSLAVTQNERFGSTSAMSGEFASTSATDATTSTTLSVFSTFVQPDGRRTSVTLCMPRTTFRGVDVVNAFLQQIMASDARLEREYASNPRLYKLFIADEVTGEEEMAVQLDLAAQNFSTYCVQPLPAARLSLFPQRTDLLPTVSDYINLRVCIRPAVGQGKEVQRVCVVPPDILAESLETVVSRRLPGCGIVQGSLRIKYGPLELNINEYYNFGPGCGQMSCPIAEFTVLTLYRFGVTEVVVTGRAVEEATGELAVGAAEDIVVELDVDEAMRFQQFEVISTNKYGARQQRLLCVDGEHLYTMRPNISDAMPKTTERMIADIEDVRRFPNKPTYMEIVYTRASGFEKDHFECTTAYNCALLDEKLRLLRRELRKKAAEQAAQKQERSLQRFFQGFYNRLRLRKSS